MRGGNGRPGGKLHRRMGRRGEDIDAGRGERDVAAAIGAREQVIVHVGCRHRDHVGVGGRIKRRRFCAGIPGRGDEHQPHLARPGERFLQRGIGGSREAHVDHARAMLDRPVEA